jgi:SPX domain protein involved in polyphosphate accumulation
VKSGEISRRIKLTEKEIDQVIKELNNDTEPPEDTFLILQEEVSDIIADVHDLAHYARLNYTAFEKILVNPPRNPILTCRKNMMYRFHNYGVANVEKNFVYSQANLCSSSKCKTILQRKLRCSRSKTLQTVRFRANSRKPCKGGLLGRRKPTKLCS